jgi:hypothetical protein
MEDLVGAMVDSAVATHTPHRRAEISIEGTPMEAVALMQVVALMQAVARFMAAEDIMAAADTMAPVSASVSEFTRLTDMPRRSVIPPDSMMPMAFGNLIRVAPCPTDIKLSPVYSQPGPMPYGIWTPTASTSRILPLTILNTSAIGIVTGCPTK